MRSLPDDDRIWLLAWLGPLFMNPEIQGQRSILAVMMTVRDFNPETSFPQMNNTHRLVTVPVGELPALTIGRTYQRGRPTRKQPPLSREVFRVDFGAQSVMRLDDDEGEERLWPLIGPRSAAAAFAHSACISLPLESNGRGVLTPLSEMIRFCYGSSSRMIQAVLSDALPDLLDDVATQVTWNGQTCVFRAMPPGFSERDAHTLAWLLTDQHARRQAQRLDTSFMAGLGTASGAYPPLSHPSGLFPFTGTHDLRVRGRWLRTGERQRFLVHQIESLSFTPGVVVSLPRASNQAGEEGEPQPRIRRLPGARLIGSVLEPVAQPRSGRAALLPARPSQFSGQVALRHDVPAPPTRDTPMRSPPVPEGVFSTGPHVDPDSRARPGTLSEPQDTPQPTAAAEFDALREVARLLRRDAHDVRELSLGMDASPRPPGMIWSCLILEVSRGGRRTYLLEKQRLSSTDFGPLIVAWRMGHQPAGDGELLTLLAARVGQRTWPRTVPGWSMGRVTHAYTSPETFRDAIARHL